MNRIYRTTEPFFLNGNEDIGGTAVLLIHGFTGSPSEFRRLAYYLNDCGCTVQGIRLPGHGTTPEEMIKTGLADWWQHVLESYEALQERYRQIVVIGHSMGGLLALKLAVEKEVKGIVSLSAPIFLTSKKTAFAILLRYFITYIEKKPKDERELLEEAYSYSKMPVACIVSLRKLIRLVKCSLPRIAAPVFIAQGERDDTVEPRSADYIYRHIASSVKRLKVYPRSSHIIMLDADRDRLYADIIGFIRLLDGDASV